MQKLNGLVGLVCSPSYGSARGLMICYPAETARLDKVQPAAYFKTILKCSDHAAAQTNKLLPWNRDPQTSIS